MQSKLVNQQQDNLLTVSPSNSMILTYSSSLEQQQPFLFQVSFAGFMNMYSDLATVANYLNAHEGWFCRCAQPMQVEALNNNGYIITVGRFGSLGYEVEPKIAVVLEPPVESIYKMHTIPIPDYQPPGYDVNYRASMELTEIEASVVTNSTCGLLRKKIAIPAIITQVNWTLDLDVMVEFPKFVHKLPTSVIQVTGDRLLAEIVKQVSPRLTYKVQEDFHNAHQLPMPPKSSRKLEKISKVASEQSNAA